MVHSHVMWDWNGTLFDDTWLGVEVINRTLALRQMPTVSMDEYRKLFTFPVIEYYRSLGFDFEKESFEKVGTEWVLEYERRRHEAGLHKGARETLTAIREHGLTQSILSAYKQNTLSELVTYHGLDEFFLKVIGLGNHYAGSKEEIARTWMEELPYRPEEVLFVGDTVHDHEVAQAIGVDCVLIPNGHQTRERLVETGSRVVETLEEVFTTRWTKKNESEKESR